MFRLTSLDPDTNIHTNWTVGESEREQLGGLQTRTDLGENVRASNSVQFLFRQDGKRLYNATKTRALYLCPESNRCKWTSSLEKASDFSFVRQKADSEQVWLVAEKDRLVLGKAGKFEPYSELADPIDFTREMQQPVSTKQVTVKEDPTVAAAVVTSGEDDRWGNWIYVLLVFFIVLLLYFIYLLDLATCVFSSRYKPVISPEVHACVSDELGDSSVGNVAAV